MSEAKQTLIPEDLRWLAENESEWNPSPAFIDGNGESLIFLEGEKRPAYCHPDSLVAANSPEKTYTKQQWRDARKALGGEPEPWPEERINTVALNGATGDHYPEPGQKHDSAKPRMDLIPPLMEMEVARVLTFGAEKYSANNWRQVPDLQQRYIAAAKRHINAIQQGEEIDPESGLRHAAHAVCCLMFIGEIDMEYGH